MKERIAGTATLALAAVVAAVSVGHLVQTIALVVSGNVAPTSVESGDGALVVTQSASGGAVTLATAVSSIISDVTILGVLALAAAIGISLVRGRPFGPRITTAVTAAGIAVAVGGTLSAAIASFGNGQPIGSTRGEPLSGALDIPLGFLTISLLPLAAGLMIVLLGFIFRAGSRLQRDTEGLV